MHSPSQVGSHFDQCTVKYWDIYLDKYVSTLDSQQNLDHQLFQSPQHMLLNSDSDLAIPIFTQDDSLQSFINHMKKPRLLNSLALNIKLDPPFIIRDPCSANQTKKSTKNNNIIKKIGRIILNHLSAFEKRPGQNQGVQAMLNLLSSEAGERRKLKTATDIFNFSHLKALLFDCSPRVSRKNLRIARQLFNNKLRKQIFSSSQIKGKSTLVYLNTLKCSGLRFCNKNLALRMQLSKIQE